MAAVPFFIQSAADTAGRYCHQLDDQPHQGGTAAAKSEPEELFDGQQPFRSPTMDGRACLRSDASYYRSIADFTGGYHHQYPSSLLARSFGNGYCRSAYAEECARRYPVEADSYFAHSGSVQPAWTRAGVFPFPVRQEEFGRRLEYAATTDCCRTDEVPFAGTSNPGRGQPVVSDGGGQRRRPTVNDRSPPPPLRTTTTTSNSCCRLDSTDGAAERDNRVPTTMTSDNVSAITSTSPSKSAANSSTTATSAAPPVVVYPWMRKLHSRTNSTSGQS